MEFTQHDSVYMSMLLFVALLRFFLTKFPIDIDEH